MLVEDLVIVDLDGAVVDGTMRPSTEMRTHSDLHRRFPNIDAIADTLAPTRSRGSPCRSTPMRAT